jgi:DNA-binding NtrC family response regulator
MAENIQRMLNLPETTVTAYADPVTGLADALTNPPDLVLLGMRMPRISGEEVLARLRQEHPGLPIVLLTAFGSVEGAVLAMRNGAFDYLQEPFNREDLLVVVKRALSQAELEQEVQRLKERLTTLHPGGVLEPYDIADDLQPTSAACHLSSLPWKETREQYLASLELSYSQALLARCNGNIGAAAREAGVDRKTFCSLLKRDRDPQAEE